MSSVFARVIGAGTQVPTTRGGAAFTAMTTAAATLSPKQEKRRDHFAGQKGATKQAAQRQNTAAKAPRAVTVRQIATASPCGDESVLIDGAKCSAVIVIGRIVDVLNISERSVQLALSDGTASIHCTILDPDELGLELVQALGQCREDHITSSLPHLRFIGLVSIAFSGAGSPPQIQLVGHAREVLDFSEVTYHLLLAMLISARTQYGAPTLLGNFGC